MTEREFQEMNGFCDEDMAKIKACCLIFKGAVVQIAEGQGRAQKMIDFIKERL